jgi:hypothetical protein
MYMIYIFGVMVALAATVGTILFALSAILVTIRAGAEIMADAATVSLHKLVSAVRLRPKIAAVHPVPYHPTFRR